MGKKSREKRMRRETKASHQPDFELHTLRHPFEGLSRDVVTKGMIDIGRSQATHFATTTTSLQDLLARVNPLCLVSAVAAYGLSVGVRKDGTINSSALKDVQQAHVELIQALCLRIPIARHSAHPALGENVQEICDTTVRWAQQFHAKRFIQLESAATDVDRSRLHVQERIRLATQLVRNWGYYDQVKRIVTELMRPLEDRFVEHFGFQSADLVRIFDYMFAQWTERLSAHWDRLSGMMTAATIREAIVAYYAAFPDLVGTVEDMLMEMRRRGASLKELQLMMLSHSDIRLPDLFTFEAPDIAVAIGRPKELVARALQCVSLSFGDLKNANVEHFFMHNPVWTRPAIGLTDDKVFCVIPQLFFGFWFEFMIGLLRDNEPLRRAYDERRSEYLEQRTTSVFASALPGATIIPNFTWHSQDRRQQFESDLVIRFDSFLLIVEAKSGRVPSESRRGAPDSLGEIIDALLVEPSRQSQRLQEAILAAKRGDSGTEAFRTAFPVDLSTIHRVIRLSVTLEDISFLQTHISALKDAGYVPQELVIAPSVTIADLEVVFEVLRSVPERIHYWVRRSEWEERADYEADEIDLLGVYLKTGLDLGSLEFGKTQRAHLILIGESRHIDDYFEKKRHGIVVAEPKYQCTEWWQEILDRLSAQKPDRWIEATVVLLSAGLQQQTELERRTKSVIADVARRRERAASRNALIFVAAKGRPEGICTVVLTGDQMPDRHAKMENVAAQAFGSDPQMLQCVVIVVDVDGQKYPYSTLGVYTRPIEEAVNQQAGRPS